MELMREEPAMAGRFHPLFLCSHPSFDLVLILPHFFAEPVEDLLVQQTEKSA
jgi:hypothetical protein